MILFYAPTACSIAPHIALEEIGVPFEARRIDLAKGEQTSEAFLRINPLGRVPAMVIDGAPVTELPASSARAAAPRRGRWPSRAASNGWASCRAACTSLTRSSAARPASCARGRRRGTRLSSKGG